MSAEPIILKPFEGASIDSENEQMPVDTKKSRLGNERIKVVGVGGGGCNAVDHIIRSGISGVDFLALNTDVRSLDSSLASTKIVLGKKLTRGLGAGARPEIGEKAAIESREEIRRQLRGADMVYLAAGMGGGTGTGALPIIAALTKEMGILTVAVVTKPFSFEGKRKAQYAADGIEKLEQVVDALITVPNDKLLSITDKTTSLSEAFAAADGVLRQAVQGVTDLITRPGSINVDFADLCTVMRGAGSAVMGIGNGKGEGRANAALKQALESPLMENSIRGAKGVLFNVTGGQDINIFEVNEAAGLLQDYVDEDASFIWGLVQDDRTDGTIEMVIIATGFNKKTSEPISVSKPNNESHKKITPEPLQPVHLDEPMSVEETEDESPVATEESILFGPGEDYFDTPSFNRKGRKKK